MIQSAKNISVIMDLQVSFLSQTRQLTDLPIHCMSAINHRSEKLNVPSLESISSFTLGHIGRIVELRNSFITSSFSELDTGCGSDVLEW
jgi:hypothetical protein